MKISQNTLEILERCRIEGNVLYLPPGQLNRNDYEKVNKCIENIGGKWNRKAKGHIFDSDPSEAFDDMLLSGETTNMKKLFQFFPTPRAVAERMCDLAELTEDSIVLEPSVGKGSIADAVWDRGVAYLLGIELNQEMKSLLNDKPYPTMVGIDFLEFAQEVKNGSIKQCFTHIIMNPPFSKQREIEHIMAAYELLVPGGILVSVVSNSPFWRKDAKSQDFRDWLNAWESFEFLEEIDLPAGAFKESGTMISTKIIKLRRDGALDSRIKPETTPEPSFDSCDDSKAKTHSTRSSRSLMKVHYYDPKEEIGIDCYADTVVIERDEKAAYIAAVRLSGYPESVRGVSDAIYGGAKVTFEIEGEDHTLSGKVKQYRREYGHDGLYAEAVLQINDDLQQQIDMGDDDTNAEDNNGDTDNEVSASAPRKCYIFCAKGDNDQLFEEVDKKTAVPLIPDFQDYMLTTLQHRDILRPLEVISSTEEFDAWVLHMSSEETNIINVVNDGLHNGHISIPGANGNEFPEISGVTGYLNAFGVQIAERIRGQFNPLFDPATEALSPEVLAVNKFIKANAGYSLFDAQLAASEAIKRRLCIAKDALLIAECGTGKTKIGASALHAYQQRLHFRQYNLNDNVTVRYANRSKHFNIVLCPSHMAEKWVREIEESLPNTFAVIVNSISDIDLVYRAYENDNKTCYIILTKEKARDGYMRRPAALWNSRRKAFICPCCYEVIMMDIIEDGSKYKVKADSRYFRMENKKNRKCENPDCETVLWTALTAEQQSDWVKVAGYGYVHRRFAFSHLTHVEKKPKVYKAILEIGKNPDGHYPNTGAYRRVPLSTYIKQKMKGKIDGLIVDEIHNFNNDSGQGDAMGELFQAAKKVIGMTATLINGYSSGIFHLFYRIIPHLMLLDNKTYEKPNDFNNEYGVSEAVYEVEAPDYNANRRSVKRKIREKQLPGVSPMVYSRFLLEGAVFLSLNDMGKDLPEYEEIPIQLDMNSDVANEYNRIRGEFLDLLKEEPKIAKKLLSVYLNLLTVYPDQPYEHEPIKHPVFGDMAKPLIIPRDTSSIDELHEKDQQVVDLVQRKAENGERVLIYTSWTRIDTQKKLSDLLSEQGYRVATLTAAVPPKKREAWVEKQVKKGVQVLICNPSLVETGLDLNDFTTILFYNISYKLFTLRQASRRSWRINQRAPRIEVYFFFYEDTMQHKAIRLMASKLAVAGVIEGNLTDEGLAAMSDCQDMTTALARELTQGIEGEVEDLSAVFKRMALLKPVSETADEAVINADTVESAGTMESMEGLVAVNVAVGDKAVVTAPDIAAITDTDEDTATPTPKVHAGTKPPVQSSGLMSLLKAPAPKKKQKKKGPLMCEDQLTLFDIMENTA